MKCVRHERNMLECLPEHIWCWRSPPGALAAAGVGADWLLFMDSASSAPPPVPPQFVMCALSASSAQVPRIPDLARDAGGRGVAAVVACFSEGPMLPQ